MLVADRAPLTAPDLMVPTDMLALLGPEARAVWQAGFGHLPARPVSVYPQGVEAAYATFLTAVTADAREAILPFILGAGVAYLLDPVADRLERAGLTRVMSVVVITVATALALRSRRRLYSYPEERPIIG